MRAPVTVSLSLDVPSNHFPIIDQKIAFPLNASFSNL